MSESWNDRATNIRNGEELDLSPLRSFIVDRIPELDGELEVLQFPSGHSNLTYLLQFGKKELVLRRPPFGAKVKSGHDMSREYKILKALEQHYPKAPKAYLFSDDPEILGAPFYIMERVNGVILRPNMPKEMIPAPSLMKGISQSVVETLSELHSVDYEAAGLGDLGKPEGYVGRQISGWAKRFFKAKTHDIPAMEFVARWLDQNQPKESGATLIHNDFKYDNMVLDPKDWKNVVAILDWEMSTLGDPLMDLGTSLGYWINKDDPAWLKELALSPTTLDGNPTRGELVQMYAKTSGRDVEDVIFYYVYGLFKIAVISQQIYYRYKLGYTNDRRFANFEMVVSGLASMAQQAIHRKRIDDLF